MDMECTLYVAHLDESREFSLLRCFYFTGVLAKFRHNIGKTKHMIYFFFTFQCNQFLTIKKSVFVKLEPLFLCYSPEPYIVFLAAGKIHEGVRKFFFASRSSGPLRCLI